LIKHEVFAFLGCPNDDLLISISDQPVARVGSDGAVYFLGGICGAGADISVPNLIAWYPFESDFNDDSGNQFNATDSGCGFNCKLKPCFSFFTAAFFISFYF